MDADFAGGVWCNRATFGVAAFGGVRFHDTVRFDGARFPEQVSFVDDANLDHYRFLDTTFEGFDFAAYRDRLAAVDWRLHEVEWPTHESDGGREETHGGDGADAKRAEDRGDVDDTDETR